MCVLPCHLHGDIHWTIKHTHTQNDSGIGSRVQRFSEQLVLYAKAIALLKSSLLEYELIMASKSMEPSQSHKKGTRVHSSEVESLE